MWISQCMYGTCQVIIFIISATFVNPQQFFCNKDAVFKKVNRGKPLDEDVISNHYVSSWFECSSKCLNILECVAFSHRTGSTQQSHRDSNCKISKSKSEFVEGRSEGEAWKTYEIRNPGVEICSAQNLCLNNGRCVRNSCDPEGYMCICDDLHDGKHCENDKDKENFDVVFASQQPNISYIEVDNMISSDLTQFTFSTWIKIRPGQSQYHILSHKTNVTVNIDFLFNTKDETRVPIQKMSTKLLQITESVDMIPVNDNIWHHLGIIWNNTQGRLVILVDGTPRYINEDFQKDQVVPGGGKFIIGQQYGVSQVNSGFLGQISGMNFWNISLPEEMVESMAREKVPLKGNVIKWSNVLGNMFGDIEVIRPSNARNTNTDPDFELKFEPSDTVNYVLSPGPSEPFIEISICLWMKTVNQSTFVYYDVEDSDGDTSSFSFGIDAAFTLFVNVNGQVHTSNISDESIVNNNWQYICVVLKDKQNKIFFYHDGTEIAEVRQASSNNFLPEGKFRIGVTNEQSSYVSAFLGTVTCLNIWSFQMTGVAIRAMASGALNVNGDLLAWRNVPTHIVGNVLMIPNTEVYSAGFSLYARRSKWCNEQEFQSCSTQYARIGGDIHREMMAWRCYCRGALSDSTFNYKGTNTAYETRHEDLLTIV